jgi:hypothetical protein
METDCRLQKQRQNWHENCQCCQPLLQLAYVCSDNVASVSDHFADLPPFLLMLRWMSSERI